MTPIEMVFIPHKEHVPNDFSNPEQLDRKTIRLVSLDKL